MVSDYLTIDELSKYLNVRKSTLYFKVASGDLPHYRIGRLIRFKKCELDDWLEKHRGENVEQRLRKNRVFKTMYSHEVDIDKVVEKTIDEVKRKRYTSIQEKGKPDQKLKGLETKEV